MKRCIMLLLSLGCLVICCTACSLQTLRSNDQYDIVKEDGKYYISFNSAIDETKNVESSLFVSVAAGGLPEFTSVSEMKERVESGDLEEEDVQELQLYYAENGVWEIYNLDELYDAQMPNGTSVNKVTLCGKNYLFELNSDAVSNCFIRCCDEERYNEEFQKNYAGSPNALQTVTRTEEIGDRNATQIYYENESGQYKVIKYIVGEENRKLYIIETYALHRTNAVDNSDFGFVSETIPHIVEIFAEENGSYAHMWMMGFKERPSVEWISSFGLVPYEEQ